MHTMQSIINNCISQLKVTGLPCVVFSPEQYGQIYNVTAATLPEVNNQEDPSQEQEIKVDILLHKIIDETREVINFVNASISAIQFH